MSQDKSTKNKYLSQVIRKKYRNNRLKHNNIKVNNQRNVTLCDVGVQNYKPLEYIHKYTPPIITHIIDDESGVNNIEDNIVNIENNIVNIVEQTSDYIYINPQEDDIILDTYEFIELSDM